MKRTHGHRVAGRVIARLGGTGIVVQPDGGDGVIEAQLPPSIHKGHRCLLHLPAGPRSGVLAQVIEYEAGGHVVRVAKAKGAGASE
jgi:hypothetical protein